jgi:hypothetical protein
VQINKTALAYKSKISENQTLTVGFNFGLNRESFNYRSGFNQTAMST